MRWRCYVRIDNQTQGIMRNIVVKWRRNRDFACRSEYSMADMQQLVVYSAARRFPCAFCTQLTKQRCAY